MYIFIEKQQNKPKTEKKERKKVKKEGYKAGIASTFPVKHFCYRKFITKSIS